EAMLAHWFDEYFQGGKFNALHEPAHLDAAFRCGPSGAAIGDDASVVDGAEVAADCHIARADLEIDAERFEDAAAYAIFQWIVAKQAEMAGPASRRDARQHRHAEAAHAFAGTTVQIRCPR